MTYIAAELRRLIIERAGACCEYCRVNRDDSGLNYHVEHIIALSHGGQTTEQNLAYSCSRCNYLKGVNIAAADPETAEPTFLFHPRKQLWAKHFVLEAASIQPLTPEGRATVFVLRFNEPQRIAKRHILLQLGRYPCADRA